MSQLDLNVFSSFLQPDQIIDHVSLKQRAVSYWDSSPTLARVLLKPTNAEELSQILKVCNKYKQPVVTQGGLSGVVRGSDAADNEVIISLEKMNQIENIDSVGGTATIQAGVILQTAQESLADQGWLLPLDLGARGSCTIGGNVATNAGGINVLRYGMMRNQILGLEAVLADGTIISSMNQMLKNNAGYDLKQLFIGTEGTLGIVTRVIIRCFPLPVSCNTAFVALTSFNSVVKLLKYMESKLGGNLCAYEVLWGEHYRAITTDGHHLPPLDRHFPLYVILESQGSDTELDTQQFNMALEQAFEQDLIEDAVIPKSESERRKLWDIRENFEAVLQTDPVYLYDVSLPIRHMEEYVLRVKKSLTEKFKNPAVYTLGHIADGNLHFFIQPGISGNHHHSCDEAVYLPLSDYNGSVSAEHGIGIEKKHWLSSSRSNNEVDLMKLLKKTLDPNSILNPGRIFDIQDTH